MSDHRSGTVRIMGFKRSGSTHNKTRWYKRRGNPTLLYGMSSALWYASAVIAGMIIQRLMDMGVFNF